MTQVSIKALTKTFAKAAKPAVDRLSLDIPSGALLALLGPSGCGKTTTLRMIAGLLTPSSGDITFDQSSALTLPAERRGAVMVFQNYLLFPHMSVADNIGFGLRMRAVPRPEVQARVDRMLQMVQLPGFGHRRPAELSGGQQQRAALARALIVQPRVLLLDEPLSSLDAHLRLEMRDLIRSLQKELGITTIFVTHDQEEAVVLADQIALILDGRLRQFAPAETFYKRPADEAVARFFGGQNFVRGQSEGGRFHSGLGTLTLPEGARTGAGLLTFRPESVLIGGKGENTLPARLTHRVFLGTQTRLTFTVGDQAITAVANPDAVEGLAPGDEVQITLPRPALWVLD